MIESFDFEYCDNCKKLVNFHIFVDNTFRQLICDECESIIYKPQQSNEEEFNTS